VNAVAATKKTESLWHSEDRCFMRGQSAWKQRTSQALFGRESQCHLFRVRHFVTRHPMIAHERRPNAQENLKRVRHIAAVISIEPIRHTVDRELPAKPNIDS